MLYKIGDFLMEILGEKEFLAVTDDESYMLLCEHLHKDAGKDNLLVNLKTWVISNNPDDMVCFFLLAMNFVGVHNAIHKKEVQEQC